MIKPLSEQFNSCLHNKHAGLSEADSTFCIDMNRMWCQWRMFLSKLWCRWGEVVDQVVASFFSSSISLIISSFLLFPSCLLFLPLFAGSCCCTNALECKAQHTGRRDLALSVFLAGSKFYRSHFRSVVCFESRSLWGTHLGKCTLECSLGNVRRLLGAIDAIHTGVQSFHTFFLF